MINVLNKGYRYILMEVIIIDEKYMIRKKRLVFIDIRIVIELNINKINKKNKKIIEKIIDK
jgi:hypothetical protein